MKKREKTITSHNRGNGRKKRKRGIYYFEKNKRGFQPTPEYIKKFENELRRLKDQDKLDKKIENFEQKLKEIKER